MSLIITVNVPTGIVISGDSRTTGTFTQLIAQPTPQNPTAQVTVQTPIVLSDAAHKVFFLFSRFGVGTFGDAIVNNLPIAHHVESFAAILSQPTPTTVVEVADSLLRHFRALAPVPNVFFVVAGYDGSVPWVMDVGVQAGTVKRMNLDAQANQVTYGLMSGGGVPRV